MLNLVNNFCKGLFQIKTLKRKLLHWFLLYINNAFVLIYFAETLVSHKNIAIQVADTNADLLHGHTFNSLDEPVLTGSANLALDPLPSSSTCQPLTSFTMQPVFYSEATQHPGFLFPAVVPHQLDTEYLSQLFFHSKKIV